MDEARKSRMEHLKRCKQMNEDNNVINKIVEEQRQVIKRMHVEGLIKLKCIKCIKERHCEVNSDERCRQVVEQFENASKEMMLKI